MQCRAHVAQLGRINDEFVKAGAQILVILGDTLDLARGMQNYSTPHSRSYPIQNARSIIASNFKRTSLG